MKIFNFADENIDSLSILKEIQEDPWLHYGGIIGIHGGADDKKLLEAMQDANIIALLRMSEFIAWTPTSFENHPSEQTNSFSARDSAASSQDYFWRLRHR